MLNIEESYKNLSKWIARRKLEASLYKISRLTTGHRANKVKPGNIVYVTLYELAYFEIQDFCSKFKVNPEDIFSQVPFVGELKNLAYPKKLVTSNPKYILVASLLSILIIYVIGMFTSFIGLVFTYGYNAMHVLWRLL
jgi:hypothetical protein